MFGLCPCRTGRSLGREAPEENARILREILTGKKGAARDIVLMNAGAAIYVGGRALNLAEGVRLAAASIDSGHAQEKLDALIRATARCMHDP